MVFSSSIGLDFSNLSFSFDILKIQFYISRLVNPDNYSQSSSCKSVSSEKESLDSSNLVSKMSCSVV